MLKPSDFIREPCTCPECEQAGVSDQPQQRDPSTGIWLHGYALKRTLEAKDRFWSLCHEGLKRMSMPEEKSGKA